VLLDVARYGQTDIGYHAMLPIGQMTLAFVIR